MNWNGVNLERKLKSERKKTEKKKPDEILAAFRRLLADDDATDEQIAAQIFNGNNKGRPLHFRDMDPERIYHIDQIRKLCTNYRLRFLDARHFKGEIPYEAIGRIKKLQREERVVLSNYKIMAPAPMFNLVRRDRDPLLFVPLGDKRFYLVHKWGKDLHPMRRLIVFPGRNFASLLGTIAALALLVVMCIPNSVMLGPLDESSLGIRAIFFLYLFIAFSGLTVLYGFSRMKNFNANLWNSKYTD